MGMACGSPLRFHVMGVKRTWPIALHMSANGPKADKSVSPSLSPSAKDNWSQYVLGRVFYVLFIF
jgi:hypothetical protein